MLPDIEAGKRFYGELFGWTFGTPAPQPHRYTLAFLDGRPVAGLFAKPDGRLPTAWNLHLATDDAAAAVARVRAAAGQVLMEPMDVDGLAVNAMAADPGGAVFGLWQAVEFDGFGARGEPGAYVWSELCTHEKEAVDAFYADVFGYAMREPDAAGAEGARRPGDAEESEAAEQASAGPDFMAWAAAGDPVDREHAIGGRRVIDGSWPAEMPAHFLACFAVADCDSAVHTTVRLGGRVRSGPQDTPYGRRAVLIDNQGAGFAVLRTPGMSPDPAGTA